MWNEGVNMNDILFRAKAINRKEVFEYRTSYKNGDWVYGLITKKFDDEFPILPAEMTNEDGVSGIDVDYKTIGQYTGLTDKNGTKIFEGDIVETKYGRWCQVIWFSSPRSQRWNLIPLEDKHKCPDDYDLWTPKNLEVIGNVHDNLDLIKA